MKLLLDTCALLWWVGGDTRLKIAVRELILAPDTEVLVSVVSLWEIVVKTRSGKFDIDLAEIELSISEDGFGRLPISSAHLTTLARLPAHHRDPFDHLLIAQAISEKATIVSDDGAFARYPVQLMKANA